MAIESIESMQASFGFLDEVGKRSGGGALHSRYKGVESRSQEPS